LPNRLQHPRQPEPQPQLTLSLARHQVGGTAAFATAMHVAMHYVVMVQKADEDGGPTVTSNALGTRSGVTGHIVLGLMALMFLTAWDRCDTLRRTRCACSPYWASRDALHANQTE
jgi:hypothetical protein